MSVAERLGRCYELAHKQLYAHSAATLVHGVIRDTHLSGLGAVILHAWLEIGDESWEPITQLCLPSDVFMRLFDAEIIHRYSIREATLHALETGHYGPWQEMPKGIERTIPEISMQGGNS